jgi:hypothetical protein
MILPRVTLFLCIFVGAAAAPAIDVPVPRVAPLCHEKGDTTVTWATHMPDIWTNHVFRLDDLLSIVYSCSENNSSTPQKYSFTIALESPTHSGALYFGTTYARNSTQPFVEISQRGFAVPSFLLPKESSEEIVRWRFDLYSHKHWFALEVPSWKITALSPPFKVKRDPWNGARPTMSFMGPYTVDNIRDTRSKRSRDSRIGGRLSSTRFYPLHSAESMLSSTKPFLEPDTKDSIRDLVIGCDPSRYIPDDVFGRIAQVADVIKRGFQTTVYLISQDFESGLLSLSNDWPMGVRDVRPITFRRPVSGGPPTKHHIRRQPQPQPAVVGDYI